MIYKVLLIFLFPILAHSKIVLIGDSITEGQFSGPNAITWAQLVALRYDTVNTGLGGTNSLDWSLKLFKQRALPHMPADFVTLMLGTNDSVGFMRKQPITPEEYDSAMRTIVKDLTQAGAKKIMIMFPPKRFYDKPEVNTRIKAYIKKLKTIIKENKQVVKGPNFYKKLNTSHFEGVDIHPNAYGYKKMADEILKSIGRYYNK